MARCPDCDGPAVFGGGNGACGHCHGTGTEPDSMPFIAGLATFGLAHIEPDECSNCGGSGECPTCDGTGEVEQETSYSAPSSSDNGDSVTDHENSYSGGGSSYGGSDSYSSSGGGSISASDSLVGWFGAFLLIVFIIIGVVISFKALTDKNKEKGPPLVDISSTPPSKRPAMYVPAIRMPNENCVGLYLCTEENYNPKEWRVTSKTVSRTFDGGRTWHTLWGSETSRYIIRDMKAIDNREGTERSLRPGKRDIFLIIEEP